jgi:hypothetical protein
MNRGICGGRVRVAQSTGTMKTIASWPCALSFCGWREGEAGVPCVAPARRGGVWVIARGGVESGETVRAASGANPRRGRGFSGNRNEARDVEKNFERGRECGEAGRSAGSPALAERLCSARLIASRLEGATHRLFRDQRSVTNRFTMATKCASRRPPVATIRTLRISITTFNLQTAGRASPIGGGIVPARRTLGAAFDNSMAETPFACD